MAQENNEFQDAFIDFLRHHRESFCSPSNLTTFTQTGKTIPGGKTVWEVVKSTEITKGRKVKELYGVIADGKLWMYDANYPPDNYPFPLAKPKSIMLEEIAKDSIQSFQDYFFEDGEIDWDDLTVLGVDPFAFRKKCEESDPDSANELDLPGYMAAQIENSDQTFKKVLFMEEANPAALSTRRWKDVLFGYVTSAVRDQQLARLIYQYQLVESNRDKGAI